MWAVRQTRNVSTVPSTLPLSPATQLAASLGCSPACPSAHSPLRSRSGTLVRSAPYLTAHYPVSINHTFSLSFITCFPSLNWP